MMILPMAIQWRPRGSVEAAEWEEGRGDGDGGHVDWERAGGQELGRRVRVRQEWCNARGGEGAGLGSELLVCAGARLCATAVSMVVGSHAGRQASSKQLEEEFQVVSGPSLRARRGVLLAQAAAVAVAAIAKRYALISIVLNR